MTAVIELIVAASDNDVIGRGNKLPWHLPADLRHFKLLTLGKPILMGRKTYESIGKALPQRMNLVMSRSAHFSPGDCQVVGAVEEACAIAGDLLMVIGGAEVYRQCLPLASRIHLTLVHTRIEDGDTFFRDWRLTPWLETARQRFEHDDKNAHAYSFITLERNQPPFKQATEAVRAAR
jgi:dihydrofolate reductase